MEDNLRKLYSALSTIETKGSNTITMGNCLRFIEQMIAEEHNKQKTDSTESTETSEE